MTRKYLFILTAVACSLLATLGAAEELAPDSFEYQLRQRIVQHQANRQFICHGELLCGIADLPRFYANRAYQPAWTHTTGPLPAINELISAVMQSRLEGLRPADYHLAVIQTLWHELQHTKEMEQPLAMQRLVDLELLCTDAFLLLASHLAAGRVNPETIRRVVSLQPSFKKRLKPAVSRRACRRSNHPIPVITPWAICWRTIAAWTVLLPYRQLQPDPN